jgi:hypothetical protein
MLFPPFSNMYAMSSVCNPTYADKEIIMSDCFTKEIYSLSCNVMLAAKLARAGKTTDWKNDYSIN